MKMSIFFKNTIAFFLFVLSFQMARSQCNIDDWTALKALYESTNGDGWTNRTGWDEMIANQNAPPINCDLNTLFGVFLDNERVIALNLDGGVLTCGHTNICKEKCGGRVGNNLQGKIPKEIELLSMLERIDLSHNQLTGQLPNELSTLQYLKKIDLASNILTGNLEVIGQIDQLVILDISNNAFSGCYPENFLTLPEKLNSMFPTVKSSNSLTIAAEEATSNVFAGNISQVMIWNEARSKTEILADMEGLTSPESESLLGYWPLSNGNTTDLTGSANAFLGSSEESDENDPQIVSNEICRIDNATEQQFYFDGNDFIKMDNVSTDIIETSNFTFEAWIKNDTSKSLSSHPIIFSNRASHGNGFKFFFHSRWGESLYKMLAVQLGGNNYFLINNGTFNGEILDGNCHHVAISKEGYCISFYIDGYFFGSREIYGSIFSEKVTNYQISQGNNFNVNWETFCETGVCEDKVSIIQQEDFDFEIKSIIPMPIYQRFDVLISHSKNETVWIELHSIVGKLLHQQIFSLQPKLNKLRIDSKDLSGGTYLLSAKLSDSVATTKIVKY